MTWVSEPKRGVRAEMFGDDWEVSVRDWNLCERGKGRGGVPDLNKSIKGRSPDVCVLWLPTGLRARHLEPPVVTKNRPSGISHLPPKMRARLSLENARVRSARTIAGAVGCRDGHAVWV